MLKICTEHAVERAKERYGLDLAYKDFAAILRACSNGEALHQRTAKGGCAVYIFTYKGARMIPVISEDGRCVVTFLPSEAVTAGSQRRHNQKTGRLKQRFACRVDGREYRREKVRRRDAEMED